MKIILDVVQSRWMTITLLGLLIWLAFILTMRVNSFQDRLAYVEAESAANSATINTQAQFISMHNDRHVRYDQEVLKRGRECDKVEVHTESSTTTPGES